MSPVTIRNADPERDAPACAAIYAPSVEASVTSFEERAPDAAEMAARIAGYTATHPWLVAEDGGEVVGYAYACPFQERPAYRWSASVSVYVAAERAGQGLGRALYTELLAGLRRQGFRNACAGITLPNPASVGLHESLGFELVGVNREVGWKHGAWRDVGWWHLQLAPAPAGEPPEPLPPEPAGSPG
ncbi:MAG TPA: arsinothricin resistance N-acetyltransferase ArsN1 family B [Solirubrobacterales bacterium]|nr:arsinothricin resistance N-acetyltransferase ArsN1 family B [Solirubrobacterales bacterium]